MCDPGDLSFIEVKGQNGLQLSVERLNMVTKVTLCATTLTRVTSMDTDSYIMSYVDFYLMGGVEQVDFCHLPSDLLIQTLQLLRIAQGMCV